MANKPSRNRSDESLSDVIAQEIIGPDLEVDPGPELEYTDPTRRDNARLTTEERGAVSSGPAIGTLPVQQVQAPVLGNAVADTASSQAAAVNEGVNHPTAQPNLIGPELGQLLQIELDRVRAQALEEFRKELQARPEAFVGGTNPTFSKEYENVVIPASYKKHYRCDVAPDLRLQRLNMDSPSASGRFEAIPGEEIRFRKGHLYTNDDQVIRQIEWVMNREAFTADGGDTNGGNQSIYEDDGADLFRCQAGCDAERGTFASFNSYRAHMKAVHNIKVSA